jgi:hypothetical protein
MRAPLDRDTTAWAPLVELTGVPPGVQAACNEGDVSFLLRWWSHVVTPMRDGEFGRHHDLFAAVCLVAAVLDETGEARMTPTQRLASLGRMGHSLRGEWLVA